MPHRPQHLKINSFLRVRPATLIFHENTLVGFPSEETALDLGLARRATRDTIPARPAHGFLWKISVAGNFSTTKHTHERGAALLATTLAVIVILLAMGLSMTSSGLFEGFMSKTQSDSREAFAAAQSGIKDAHLRIARNKNFSSAAYSIPAGCTLNGGTLCTKVVVEKNTASSCSQAISAGQDCVIAAGTLNNTTRTIETVLNVNATNGKITQASWKEI